MLAPTSAAARGDCHHRPPRQVAEPADQVRQRRAQRQRADQDRRTPARGAPGSDHDAVSFMPTGYTPARNIPVTNRSGTAAASPSRRPRTRRCNRRPAPR